MHISDYVTMVLHGWNFELRDDDTIAVSILAYLGNRNTLLYTLNIIFQYPDTLQAINISPSKHSTLHILPKLLNWLLQDYTQHVTLFSHNIDPRI
jgi:hypothetical protein